MARQLSGKSAIDPEILFDLQKYTAYIVGEILDELVQTKTRVSGLIEGDYFVGSNTEAFKEQLETTLESLNEVESAYAKLKSVLEAKNIKVDEFAKQNYAAKCSDLFVSAKKTSKIVKE